MAEDNNEENFVLNDILQCKQHANKNIDENDLENRYNKQKAVHFVLPILQRIQDMLSGKNN